MSAIDHLAYRQEEDSALYLVKPTPADDETAMLGAIRRQAETDATFLFRNGLSYRDVLSLIVLSPDSANNVVTSERADGVAAAWVQKEKTR